MKDLRRRSKASWLWFVAAIAAVIAAQALIGSTIYYAHTNWDTRGQFGDMFGAVNTLFSGLAFAGFLYAISLQRQDLQLQREELSLTRNELSRSAKAQEDTASSMVKQAEIRVLTAQVSAASALLTSIDARIERIGYSSDYNLSQERTKLQMQRNVLTATLDSAYSEISKHLPTISAQAGISSNSM